MRKDSKNFVVSANYDLRTAESMFKSGRHIYVVFMCRLVIEKILKAIVAEAIKEVPPRTHSLIALIKLGKVDLPKSLFEFVAKINNASIVTRYPEDFSKLVEVYPEEITKKYLSDTKKVMQCLKADKRLKK